MKKPPKRINANRDGLLTEQEKIHLENTQINPKIISKIYTKLNKRIEALHKDLKIIAKSPHLEVWRVKNASYLGGFLSLWLSMNKTRTFYLFPLNYGWRKKKGGGFVRIYWLDLRDKYDFDKLTPLIFNPSFTLRNIRKMIKSELTKEILKLGVELIHDFPSSKEKSISEQEISDKLLLINPKRYQEALARVANKRKLERKEKQSTLLNN